MRACGICLVVLLMVTGIRAEDTVPWAAAPIHALPGELESNTEQKHHHGQPYAGVEYLLTWIRESRLPPLVTSGSLADLVPAALGQPGTRILLEGKLDDLERSGARFTLGYWCDAEHTLGFEARGFFIGERKAHFHAESSGDPILARPFINIAGTPAQDVVFLAFPGSPFGGGSAGAADVFLTQRLWGFELNRRSPLCDEDNYRIDLLVGFRHAQMKDALDILTSSTIFTGNAPTLHGLDSFHVCNRFNGGQLGAIAEAWHGPFFIAARGAIALGGTWQEVRVAGNTVIREPGGAETALPFNLLAQSTNIGSYRQNEFSVVPELTIHAGLDVTDKVHVFVGYSLLFWSDVARAYKAIDLRINPTQNPGPVVGFPAPRFEFDSEQFWLHGLTFGVAVEF
jgi:hypothetical protein